MKKHQAYIVKWRDSSALQGWHSVDDNRHGNITTITSIGWLVKETAKVITITTSISECGNVMDALSIPKEAVTKMTKIPRHIENVTHR